MGGSAGGYLTLLLGCRLTPPPQALVSFSGYGDLLWYNEARISPVPKTVPPYEGKGGFAFYGYTRRYGIWIKEVTGLDSERDSAELKKLRPAENVTTAYPPTLLVHGKGDGDVPYEQAVKMKRALDSKGIANELVTVPSGHSSQMIKNHPEIVTKALEFLEGLVGRGAGQDASAAPNSEEKEAPVDDFSSFNGNRWVLNESLTRVTEAADADGKMRGVRSPPGVLAQERPQAGAGPKQPNAPQDARWLRNC